MMGIVDGYLAAVRVEEGTHFSGMTLFPVFREGESPLRYRTMAEGLADGSVEVREKPSASVPGLWLANRSEDLILVLDGEEIVGGKQNRMANASFLIGPKSEVELPVTCVEHGRWHDTAPRFSEGEAAPNFLRRQKEMQVKQNLRAAMLPMADQGAVWEAIAMRQIAEGIHSPTGAMHDLYMQKSVDLEEYGRAFQPVDGAIGMAVALNGRMAGADLFDQSRTAEHVWGKLVRSYAMDVASGTDAGPVTRERAEKLLKRVVGAKVETFPSIALGQDFRLEGDGANGAALVYEGIVVHLGVFRINRKHSQGDGSRIASASTRRRMQGRMY